MHTRRSQAWTDEDGRARAPVPAHCPPQCLEPWRRRRRARAGLRACGRCSRRAAAADRLPVVVATVASRSALTRLPLRGQRRTRSVDRAGSRFPPTSRFTPRAGRHAGHPWWRQCSGMLRRRKRQRRATALLSVAAGQGGSPPSRRSGNAGRARSGGSRRGRAPASRAHAGGRARARSPSRRARCVR